MGSTASLSKSFTLMNTVPWSGRPWPQASCARAKASPKPRPMPITSPVLFISGPSRWSVSGKRRNGKTGPLTKVRPAGTGASDIAKPCSASGRPSMQRVAMAASGTPVAFSRNGTVREARGLISMTWMTP